MAEIRTGGGLGVGALISRINPNLDDDKKRELVSQLSNTIMDIPLDQIKANPANPREEFDLLALEQLATSIKLHGLIQPITVRHIGEKQFQLISGERRLRASKIANLETIPAYVRLADDNQILELALIENIQRQDLNAIEIATTYDRLMNELKLTHDALAKRIGKRRSTVTNYLRLLKLPARVKIALQNDKISMGHARALVNIEDRIIQNILFEEVTKNSISVRKLESYVKIISDPTLSQELIDGIKSKVISLDHLTIIIQLPDVLLQQEVYKKVLFENLSVVQTQALVAQYMSAIEDPEPTTNEKTNTSKSLASKFEQLRVRLESQLSTKIQLKVGNKGKGQIVINFADAADLNRVLESIGYQAE